MHNYRHGLTSMPSRDRQWITLENACLTSRYLWLIGVWRDIGQLSRISQFLRETVMITEEQIIKARQVLDLPEPAYDQIGGVQVAYEWLDAQAVAERPHAEGVDLKRLNADWGGRSITESDIVIASCLHPESNGHYPHFNFSSQLTFPSAERLQG